MSANPLSQPLCVFDKFGHSYWYSIALKEREVRRKFLLLHRGKARFWKYWEARGFKIMPARIVKQPGKP